MSCVPSTSHEIKNFTFVLDPVYEHDKEEIAGENLEPGTRVFMLRVKYSKDLNSEKPSILINA